MPADKSIRKAVAELRANLELNQTDFGARLGVSAMAVSRWEMGTNDPPTDCIIQMAKMTKSPDVFWFFLEKAGFRKRDFVGRL